MSTSIAVGVGSPGGNRLQRQDDSRFHLEFISARPREFQAHERRRRSATTRRSTNVSTVVPTVAAYPSYQIINGVRNHDFRRFLLLLLGARSLF
jgi:hypothetical protein